MQLLTVHGQLVERVSILNALSELRLTWSIKAQAALLQLDGITSAKFILQ